MSAEIRSINTALTENEKAEQELLDYLIWSMKHEKDPHDLYDDPIEAFREEVKQNANKVA